MGRTKGSNEDGVTEDLRRMALLRVGAERAGSTFGVRDAATMVVQATKRDRDLLRSIARGRLALSNDELDEHSGVAKKVAQRILDASPSKRNQLRAETAARRENNRRIAISLAKRANPEATEHLAIDDPRKTIRGKVDALVRAYQRRGDEIEDKVRGNLGSGPEVSEESLLRELIDTLTERFKEASGETEESLEDGLADARGDLGDVDPAIDGEVGAYIPT